MSSQSGMNTRGLGHHLRAFGRHWLVFLIGLVLGIGSSLAYLHWTPKQFVSTAAVLVQVTPDTSSTPGNGRRTAIFCANALLRPGCGDVRFGSKAGAPPRSRPASRLAGVPSVTGPVPDQPGGSASCQQETFLAGATMSCALRLNEFSQQDVMKWSFRIVCIW